MPKVDVNGVELHYEEYGEGDETIVFSHGYLMSHKMFAAQIDALKDRYRIIAYDHRGHGGSEPYTDDFDMYDLVDDGAALIDKLVGGPVHFMGMSTGGFVAMRLMIRRPELLKSVVLIDTSADAESVEGLKQYKLMLAVVRWLGVRFVYGKAVKILMGERFRKNPARQEEYQTWRRYILGLNSRAISQFGHAIFNRDSVHDQLSKIDIPTLVIVGEEDIATPPEKAKRIAAALPNSQLVTIPNAGHTSPVEEPSAVTDAINDFMSRVDPTKPIA